MTVKQLMSLTQNRPISFLFFKLITSLLVLIYTIKLDILCLKLEQYFKWERNKVILKYCIQLRRFKLGLKSSGTSLFQPILPLLKQDDTSFHLSLFDIG